MPSPAACAHTSCPARFSSTTRRPPGSWLATSVLPLGRRTADVGAPDLAALGAVLHHLVVAVLRHHHVAVGQHVDVAEQVADVTHLKRPELLLRLAVDADERAGVGDEHHVAVAGLAGAEDVE